MRVVVAQASAPDIGRVRRFYRGFELEVDPSPSDVVLVARLPDSETILGAVWLDRSFASTVLRKMQVKDDYRGRRIGKSLLRAAAATLDGEDCWCIPWTHLSGFYEAADFTETSVELAPLFLQNRLREYQGRGLDVVVMQRHVGTVT